MTWLLVFSYSDVLTIRTPRYSFPSCIELSLNCSKFRHSLTCGNQGAMLTTKSSFCEIWPLLNFFTLNFALVVIPYIAAYNIHNFMLPYISQLFSHGNSLTFWNRWKSLVDLITRLSHDTVGQNKKNYESFCHCD